MTQTCWSSTRRRWFGGRRSRWGRPWPAIVIPLAMVALMATNVVSSVIAALLAACASVLFKLLTVEQAYRSINWTTVILMGAMIPLSTAMTNSGAASLPADSLVELVGHQSPYALLAGPFLLTALLGQLISNAATALIIIPIGLASANELSISPLPVLMNTAVASAAAFLTPVATPVNLMVMARGLSVRRLLGARIAATAAVLPGRHLRCAVGLAIPQLNATTGGPGSSAARQYAVGRAQGVATPATPVSSPRHLELLVRSWTRCSSAQ